MDTPVRVRYARVEDAAETARVNVRPWRETYRGGMEDGVREIRMVRPSAGHGPRSESPA